MYNFVKVLTHIFFDVNLHKIQAKLSVFTTHQIYLENVIFETLLI